MPLVKLVVLGATGTGKSSIIHQFLESTFIDKRSATILNPRDNSYTFTVALNGIVHEIKLMDMPMINYFPSNTLYEWTDFRACALRSAHGYILVFNLTSPGTFRYVKVIRDQLYESRNMQNVPVYVVGNKADLCQSVLNSMKSGHHGHHHHHHHHHHQHYYSHRHGSGSEDLTPAFKDLANLVKKQWKCNYIECSAKYNWHIVPIFRDILRLIESNQSKLAPETFAHQRERDYTHQPDHHRDSIKSTPQNPSTGYLTTAAISTVLATAGAMSSVTSSGQNRSILPSGTANRTTRSSNESSSSSCVLL
ncbi:ras-like protein family member 10B [Brevipalpus obovatus]|uniref:ras-like protein family member 10B n=1 Tax=Brevipalpus obovatus TaxID=246614 RepID=UPI003D9E29B4